jgi:hypothetical protein
MDTGLVAASRAIRGMVVRAWFADVDCLRPKP